MFQPSSPCPAPVIRRLPTIAAALLIALGASSGASAASTNVQFKAEASVKETYDSNVYLQDVAGAPANVAAARAAGFDPVDDNHDSLVTAVLPKIGLDYKPALTFNLSAAYAPDINFYHSADLEDYVTHRGTLNLGGKVHDTTWELLNTAAYIDGSSEGPVFARPGDIPAIGGIPLRDRREAFIFRNTFRLTQRFGDWFIRPAASTYVHDFKTKQRFTPPSDRAAYIYENYIDRQDVSGGLDVGYQAFERTFLTLGYHYGQQEQYRAPNGPGGALIDSPFDSAYHRVLVGIEGAPLDWLKLNVQVGPDIRQFSSRAKRMFPSFDDDKLLVYLDASVTVIPSKKGLHHAEVHAVRDACVLQLQRLRRHSERPPLAARLQRQTRRHCRFHLLHRRLAAARHTQRLDLHPPTPPFLTRSRASSPARLLTLTIGSTAAPPNPAIRSPKDTSSAAIWRPSESDTSSDPTINNDSQGGETAAGTVTCFVGMAGDVTPESFDVALGISMVTGIVFGLYPAARAALDPIQALRPE